MINNTLNTSIYYIIPKHSLLDQEKGTFVGHYLFIDSDEYFKMKMNNIIFFFL